MRPVLFLGLLSLAACKEPIVAPTELNDISHYLWLEWDNEDPAVLVAGIANLETWAATVPVDSDNWADRAFVIDPLPTEDANAEGLTNHGLDPADASGMGEAYLSMHPPTDHAALFGLEDQRPLEPASPNSYVRTITEGDAATFATGDSEVLVSSNAINRENFLFNVDYVLMKAWRWVTLDDGRTAVVSRSWAPDSGPVNDDGEQIRQAYSLELWIDHEGGTSLRWLVTWQDAELGIEQDTLNSLVGGSMNDAFEAQEEYLDGE